MGIGDELIVTGQVRLMQQKDKRKVRIVYERPRWHEIWDRNPRIARPEEAGDFQILRPREQYLRPYMVSKSPQQWTWREWGPPKGEIYFTMNEREYGAQNAGLVIIGHRVKFGASPNKDWGIRRWTDLAKMMRDAGIQTHHLGPDNNPRFDGAKWLPTASIRLAASVIANARLVISNEGAIHHIAAAVGTPAIVLYGGYISPKVTGYPDQVNMFTGDDYPLGCGMRLPCRHCDAAMERITPEIVLSEAMKVLG